MSDYYIHIIPVDPRYVPETQAQNAAIATLRAMLIRADDIWDKSENKIVFRDCGKNFEQVRCPGCGADLSIDTWQELMDADYSEEEGFHLEPFPLSCCNQRYTLNDLVYEMPQGFSRYALSALNIDQSLTETLITKLEDALGCRVRIIHQTI